MGVARQSAMQFTLASLNPSNSRRPCTNAIAGECHVLVSARRAGLVQRVHPSAPSLMRMPGHIRGTLNERGMALIGVLVLSALLMSLAVALALAARSDTELRGAFNRSITGFYAAESGLNAGMGEYRNIFLDYNVPHGNDFNPRSLTVGDRAVTYQLSERVGNPQNIVIPSGEVFSGLNAIQYRYIVNSKAVNNVGDTEAAVGAEFLVGYIPLFQFVAFYKNDLEILPGADMTLNGRVHTNGKLYVNANTTLAVADNPSKGVYTVQVSSGQGLYRGRKDRSECTGAVNVDKLEDKVSPFSDLDPAALGCTNGNATRLVPQSELASWKGSIISNIGNIAIPEPDIVKPPSSVSSGGAGDPGVYWDKADLRIVLHTASTMQLRAGAPNIYMIDVLTASGSQDTTKTTALRNFMMDGPWNDGEINGKGPSRMRGTMPIFYTDLPLFNGSNCSDGDWTCNSENRAFYQPNIVARTGANYDANNLNEGAYGEAMGTRFGDATTSAAFDGDARRGGFYNHREDKWMLLLNINIRDLILWNKQNGEPLFSHTDNTEGGLVIFATISGPESNSAHSRYGIRVFGSNDIPLTGGIDVSADPTGVTVASDQAVYVVGDYNRGTVNGGVARQPASLVGDSVNVLSERFWRSGMAGNGCGANCCTTRWCRDGQTGAGLDDATRDATSTWINAAFLGGEDLTNGSAYSGGLENYPRFHEDWGGGPTLTYQGSFVSLGVSEHVDGAWCGTGGNNTTGCNIYNPPTRVWNFDPGYNNAANLPPLTPRFVYVQQVLFTEDFK
jgi:hypothetical protein